MLIKAIFLAAVLGSIAIAFVIGAMVTHKRLATIVAAGLGATAVIALIITVPIYLDARSKGATDIKLQTADIGTIIEANQTSFDVDNNAEIKPGDIVVTVKYGCPTCAAIKNDVLDYLHTHSTGPVKFVSSESKVGSNILNRLNIKSGPNVIYILNNNLANGASMEYLKITKTQEDGSVVFDETAFDQFVALQASGA